MDYSSRTRTLSLQSFEVGSERFNLPKRIIYTDADMLAGKPVSLYQEFNHLNGSRKANGYFKMYGVRPAYFQTAMISQTQRIIPIASKTQISGKVPTIVETTGMEDEGEPYQLPPPKQISVGGVDATVQYDPGTEPKGQSAGPRDELIPVKPEVSIMDMPVPMDVDPAAMNPTRNSWDIQTQTDQTIDPIAQNPDAMVTPNAEQMITKDYLNTLFEMAVKNGRAYLNQIQDSIKNSTREQTDALLQGIGDIQNASTSSINDKITEGSKKLQNDIKKIERGLARLSSNFNKVEELAQQVVNNQSLDLELRQNMQNQLDAGRRAHEEYFAQLLTTFKAYMEELMASQMQVEIQGGSTYYTTNTNNFSQQFTNIEAQYNHIQQITTNIYNQLQQNQQLTNLSQYNLYQGPLLSPIMMDEDQQNQIEGPPSQGQIAGPSGPAGLLTGPEASRRPRRRSFEDLPWETLEDLLKALPNGADILAFFQKYAEKHDQGPNLELTNRQKPVSDEDSRIAEEHLGKIGVTKDRTVNGRRGKYVYRGGRPI